MTNNLRTAALQARKREAQYLKKLKKQAEIQRNCANAALQFILEKLILKDVSITGK